MARAFPGVASGEEAFLTDDATLIAAQPTGAKGWSQTTLRVIGPAGDRAVKETFLKFDLSTLPPGITGSNIVKATLVLGVDKVVGNGSFDVATVGGTWNESTVSWATAPPIIGVEVTGVVPAQNQFVTVDLTELVKDWVDGVIGNNGIALVPNGSRVNVEFDSKENRRTGHQARLIVDTNVGGLAGPQGPKGDTGDVGPQGLPGVCTNQNVSGFVNDVGYVTAAVTNGLSGLVALAGKADTNQNISLFPNDVGYLTAGVTNGMATTGFVIGQGYVTAQITNGLAVTNQNVSLFPNDAGYVTAAVTNGLSDLVAVAGKANTNQNVSLFPNDAGYVTAAVTNGLATTGFVLGQGYVTALVTNGLAVTNQNVSLFPNDAGYVTAAVTNGLSDLTALAGKADTNQNVSLFSNDAGYVTSGVTNGLATTGFVLGQGYVTALVTNGLAVTNQNVSLFPNDAGYVTKSVTNGLSTEAALAGKAATNQNVSLFPNDAGYVTSSVTNGLVTTNSTSLLQLPSAVVSNSAYLGGNSAANYLTNGTTVATTLNSNLIINGSISVSTNAAKTTINSPSFSATSIYTNSAAQRAFFQTSVLIGKPATANTTNYAWLMVVSSGSTTTNLYSKVGAQGPVGCSNIYMMVVFLNPSDTVSISNFSIGTGNVCSNQGPTTVWGL